MTNTQQDCSHSMFPNSSAAEKVNFEGQNHGEHLPSDCESGISGTDNERDDPHSNYIGAFRMDEDNRIREMIKKKLVSSLIAFGLDAQVETIQRSDYSNVMNRAKHLSFGMYTKAMQIKCGGNANVKYAWYGASKNEVSQILSHGFGLPKSSTMNGYGVYLSPADHPFESIQSLPADEDGLKHVLLCRVILGKMEVIPLGSGQYSPSSEEYDSGVDSIDCPRRYIIWSASMNTQILPEFMVSLRTSTTARECQRVQEQPRKQPNSDWMPFSTLIRELSKLLPPQAIKLIAKHHSDHRKQRITRREMIQRVRHITGDKILVMIIKSHMEKIKASRGCSIQHPDQRNRLV